MNLINRDDIHITVHYVRVVDDCFWVCSSCGFPSEASGANILYKYCPVCGAKMDAQEDEE